MIDDVYICKTDDREKNANSVLGTLNNIADSVILDVPSSQDIKEVLVAGEVDDVA